MGWAGLALASVCVGRGCTVGTMGVAVRITMGCVPEQNPSVASWCRGSLPAVPSLMQAFGVAPRPSTFSFSHSVELLCGISSSLPAQSQGPVCCGRLCTYVG